MLSSSPSSKMHLIVPSGNLNCGRFERDFNLHDLFGAIGEVFLNLLIGKLKYLQAVRISSLRRLGLCKVVDDSLVWESLLDVIVGKVHYQVPIRVGLPPHTIVEDYFLLS